MIAYEIASAILLAVGLPGCWIMFYRRLSEWRYARCLESIARLECDLGLAPPVARVRARSAASAAERWHQGVSGGTSQWRTR